MRVTFIKLRTIGFVALAVTLGLFLAQWLAPDFVTAASAIRLLPIYSVEREYKTASLTFDAAWGNEDTQQLIDILHKYEVKATFFVVGDWARKYPESVKALSDAGHEVMSHSNHHDHMTKLTADQIKADLSAAGESIAAVTGKVPTLFRAPYGEYNDKVIRTVRELGMETIQWDVELLETKLKGLEIQPF